MKPTLSDRHLYEAAKAVLTDILPFELPLRFSNEGMFRRIVKDGSWARKLWPLLAPSKALDEITIPLRFRSGKSGTDTRELWIAHPVTFSKLAMLYSSFGGQIVSLTLRSPWSLRRPTSVARSWHANRSSRRRSATTAPEVPNSANSEATERHRSSYFAYAPFSHLYRFRQSQTFCSLEKEFRLLRKLDIANCFPSIYTHSISWAIKGKSYAKRNKGLEGTFDNAFDRLMQAVNHNETAGIPIGPEFSRIFAEIILQAADLVAIRRLRETGSLNRVRVFRWVDDFFIFANRLEDLDLVEREISDALLAYNLRLKLEKSTTQVRPFALEREQKAHDACSCVRLELRFLSELLTQLGATSTAGVKLVRGDNSGLSLIDRLRSLLVGKSDDDRDEAIAASLRAIRKGIRRIRRQFGRSNARPIPLDGRSQRVLLGLVDVVFYLTSISMKMRDTFIATEIVVDLHQLAGHFSKAFQGDLARAIRLEACSAIQLALRSTERRRIEAASILHILTALGEDGRVSYSDLGSLGLKVCRDSSYFEILELIQYFGERAKEQGVLDEVVEEVVRRIEVHGSQWIATTETFLLVCDLCACPYLGEVDKMKICRAAMIAGDYKQPAKRKVKEVLDMIVADGQWLYRWGDDVDLRQLLRRKEMRPAYG